MPRKPGSTAASRSRSVTIRVVDEHGDEMSRGEIGEITVKGENVSPGYYKNREATTESFRDGWLLTGDMGYLDEDEYLFVVERKKDLMIRGGFNVYPKDVEEVIYHLPCGARSRGGRSPRLADGRRSVRLCGQEGRRRRHRGSHHPALPVEAREVQDSALRGISVSALPKTSIGKIQKKELRRAAAEKYVSALTDFDRSRESPSSAGGERT